PRLSGGEKRIRVRMDSEAGASRVRVEDHVDGGLEPAPILVARRAVPGPRAPPPPPPPAGQRPPPATVRYSWTATAYHSEASTALNSGGSAPSGNRFGSRPSETARDHSRRLERAPSAPPRG